VAFWSEDDKFFAGFHVTGTFRVAKHIGIVGDARGTTFDGNDSKSVYMALPESRMHEYPILIRTGPEKAAL